MQFTHYNTEPKAENQDIHVKANEILKDVRRNGKTFNWRGKKIKNLYYAELLEMLHFRKANNVHGCADELTFKQTDDGYLRLHQVWFCKSKLCPLCNWRRSLKMSYQNEEIISEAISQYPKARFLFLTLTVKNVYDGKELDETLKQMTKGFRKLMLYKKVSKNMIGYLRATEVTTNEKDNSFHPHFHVLLMVKSTYFKSGEYLSQDNWSQLWKKAMKLQYDPIVDVRAVKPKKDNPKDIKSAVLETSKYPVKDSDYLTNNIERDSFLVDHLETGLYRKRQVGYGLLFKEIRKKLQLDDVEDGDLKLVGKDDDEEEIDDTAQMIYAKWHNERKNYFIR